MIRPDDQNHPIQSTQATAGTPTARRRLTIVTFGFKYGPPSTNHYFDVSFVRNPAREPMWDLFSQPCADMRRFVLQQPACQAFLESAEPLIRQLIQLDDDTRIGLGCSSGRHRSCIIGEELARRLQDDHTAVRLIHREEQFA